MPIVNEEVVCAAQSQPRALQECDRHLAMPGLPLMAVRTYAHLRTRALEECNRHLVVAGIPLIDSEDLCPITTRSDAWTTFNGGEDLCHFITRSIVGMR
jgi:hypothetical protein